MRFEYKDTGRIAESEVVAEAGKLAPYIEELRPKVHDRVYAMDEAALVTPFDANTVKWAEEAAGSLGPLKRLVLIGIGGSSQGVEAVYGALRIPGGAELHVIDMMDAVHLRGVIEVLKEEHCEDIGIVIISKSGSTTETLANADVLVTALSSMFGKAIFRRIMVVSDNSTPLMEYARGRGMHTVEMPKEVGGRFSVFTAVGLVPLSLLGYDIKAFILGAATAVEKHLAPGADAALSAALLYLSAKRGARMDVLFPEDPRLNGFVLWYEQLIAESLGKRHDREGKEVFAGIVPIPMSPRELHSTAQLYLSHFPGTFTTFLTAEPELSGLSVSASGLGSLIALSGSRLYDRIPAAIMEGVRAAYKKESMPHAVYDLGELTLASLGSAMAEKMLEIMYAARLWNINAFDQPNVESYKQETRRILS